MPPNVMDIAPHFYGSAVSNSIALCRLLHFPDSPYLDLTLIRRLRRFDRLTSLPVKFETVDLGGEELALVECQVPANVNAHEPASASVEATAHNATGASADTAFTTSATASAEADVHTDAPADAPALSAGVDNLTEFLGLRIDRHADHMLISAPAIIAKLPAMVQKCPAFCSSPIAENHGCDDPISAGNPEYTGPDLRKPLGVCLFVALSCRPDVAHSAIWLSSHVGRRNLTANVARQVTRLAWYLVTTVDTHVLCFRKSDGILRALLDASLANHNSTLQSWYGLSCTLGVNTGVISFRSALARSVVASTRDSELLACLHCTYRVFALRLFLAEIGLQQSAPTPIGSDAMAVVQGISVKVVHRDSRWAAIRFAVIKQAMEDLIISCYHLPGTTNGSDIYTKILGPTLHYKHAMGQLGWPTSAARDIAMLSQLSGDSVLMVRHDGTGAPDALGLVRESDLAPSVAALFAK